MHKVWAHAPSARPYLFISSSEVYRPPRACHSSPRGACRIPPAGPPAVPEGAPPYARGSVMPMDTIGAVRPMLKPDMEALVKVTGPGGSYRHG